MKYSISEAARIAGVTRKTLYKHIDKKPISVEKDADDKPLIDASELLRVYGDKCKFDQDSKTVEPSKESTVSTQVSKGDLLETAVLEKELEMLKSQMSTEKDNFEEQIIYLRKKLDESDGETRKLTALITDKSQEKDKGAGEWEKSLKALENRLSNQEKVAKDTQEKEQKILRQNRALKKALDEERNKSFFKKLFG
jgi:hypothetical protein